MKRILLSLIFALVAFTGLQAQTIWDGTADTSWYNETSTEFEISTAEQLAGLAELVNDENDFSGKTILLTADIVLNDTSDWENWGNSAPDNTWTRIGSDYDSRFRGTFDGQGHTISGIYINSENNYQGLFGYNKGTIKNVGVKESYINGGSRVGGVCGYNDGSISNCYNTGIVHGNGSGIVGGVCGDNYDYGRILNCYNSGTVSGGGNIGGVCGMNNYKISKCYNTGDVRGYDCIGGVCGNNKNGISNCYNLGNVSGNDNIGGVCGDNYGRILNCYNSGIVDGGDCIGGVCGDNDYIISNCYNLGNVSGTDYISGVCGYNFDIGPNNNEISNCYNLGNVNGNDYIGGVCGYNYYSKISNCYNSGTVSGNDYVGGACGYNYYSTITNCYNTGTVSGNNRVGGVCGYGNKYESSTISNCYYLEGTSEGGIKGEDISGQAEVKTAKKFASGEVCWLLNEEQSEGPWGQKLGTDPYPVLGGLPVVKHKNGVTYYNEEGSAIAETSSEQASFVIVSENLTINIYGSDGEATVFNLAGIVVYHGSERIIPVHNPGIYMVRIYFR